MLRLLWDPVNKGSGAAWLLTCPKAGLEPAEPALKTAEADKIHSSGWGWLEPSDVSDRGPVYDKRGKDDKLGVTCPEGCRWEVRPGRDCSREGWDRSPN